MANKSFPGGDDLGFGTSMASDRSMNKDGSFNLVRLGEPRLRLYEIYNDLISMKWGNFFVLIFSAYFVANLFFAVLYYFIGVHHLTGIAADLDELHKFMEAFFFSSQTLTTVGFGRIAPMGILTSTIAALESMLGVLVFAVATGLLYGRFSKPQAKILYSSKAVIAPYKNETGLMIRIANMRHSQLIEVEVGVTMAYITEGASARTFVRLKLEREKISLFPTSWTIVHPIDENSPLYGVTQQQMIDIKGEVMILLKAFDETFSQTIYSRSSYHAVEIEWGKKFKPMFSVLSTGLTVMDLRLMDDMENVDLPVTVHR
jgi:inward rectifier potassium channel